MTNVALITEGSSGMGKSAALILLDLGYIVYGAARCLNQMEELKARGVSIISLDLTQDASIVANVDSINKKDGRIDILINNAGYGSFGVVEDVPIGEAKKQFEVNMFGSASITQLALPKMRENRFGRIVNVPSMQGKVYTPLGARYHATKHEVEGWNDCMRLGVKPLGIEVMVVEPGGITPLAKYCSGKIEKNIWSGGFCCICS